MTYTVWHRGRMLGESPLDFIRCMPKLRVGFLHPTPWGEKLLPLAGGVCGASNALSRAARHCSNQEERMRTPEYARFLAAIEKSESFRLELRGPDGSIIPTEDVAVRDFGFLDEPGYDLLEEEFEEDLSDSERQEEFGEETLASLGLDDWDATWDLNADADDQFGDFDESRADEPWRGEERVYDRRWSRYQLQVELVDESSVP